MVIFTFRRSPKVQHAPVAAASLLTTIFDAKQTFAPERNDTEDIGNWIVQQSWSNGKIYTFGPSSDGFSAFAIAPNPPSWLKGQYFMWTTANGYRSFSCGKDFVVPTIPTIPYTYSSIHWDIVKERMFDEVKLMITIHPYHDFHW